jgi:hypothetical protein
MTQLLRAAVPLMALGLVLSACSDARRNPLSPGPDGARAAGSLPPAVNANPGRGPGKAITSSTAPSFSLQPSAVGSTLTLSLEGVGNNAPIGSFYQAQGVTFTEGTGLVQGGDLNYSNYPPRSGTTVAYNLTGNNVSFQLARTATEVSAYVTSLYGISLTCFNAQGGQVGSASAPAPNLANYGGSVAGPNALVRVRGNGINRCTFSGTPNYFTVDDITITMEDVRLTCAPSPVERGQNVRCAMTPDLPYRVVSRRATGSGFTIEETPGTSHGANTEFVWEGPAVADTRVRVVLQVTETNGSTQQKTYNADFRVQARNWPKLQLNAPTVTVGLRGNMTAYPANGVMGNARPEMNLATVNALPITRPAAGPNTGLAFLTNPWPTVDHTIFIHPALYNNPTTPPTPSQVWHADQNGQPGGTCSQAMFAILEPFVRRHEGVTQASNSHWGITQRFYQNGNAEQRLEQIYRNTADHAVVRQAAYDEWVRLHSGSHSNQQAAFDAAEYPALSAAIGCNPDNNPNNP